MNDETTTESPTPEELPPQTPEEQRDWLAKAAEHERARIVELIGMQSYKMHTLPHREVFKRCKAEIPMAGDNAIGVLQALATLGLAMLLDKDQRKLLVAACHDETFAEQKPRLVVVPGAALDGRGKLKDL